jgi:hypothetical protein
MKTKISLLTTILLVSILLLSGSCRKSDNVAPVPAAPTASQWTFDGVTYNPEKSLSSAVSLGTSLRCNGSGQASIDVVFGSSPLATGTYSVVNGAKNSIKLAPNECVIQVSATLGNYFSSGVPGNVVTVNISGGKATVSIDKVTLVIMRSGQLIDTQNISGTMICAIQ